MTRECSLLYVSRVTIDPVRRDAEFAAIIAHAHAYNPTVGITGGLVRAKNWFAQLLEGSTDAVDTLMQSIARDTRHADVTILRVRPQNTRRLGGWSMAYAGEWNYTAQNIADVFGHGLNVDEQKIDRLDKMIVDFASA
ncbi:hypothetical protein HMP06_1417 [Sphingomonas sp. HMP6]|nr:hypothetical protein HMP06_1417 [Sphingomonas sp. HMP6]